MYDTFWLAKRTVVSSPIGRKYQYFKFEVVHSQEQKGNSIGDLQVIQIYDGELAHVR